MTKNKIFSFVVILVIIGFIFSAWFSSSVITSGDLTYAFPATLLDHTLYPYAWLSNQNNGLGGYAVPFINIHYNQVITHLVASLGFGWNLVERATQLYPLLILLIIGSYLLSKLSSTKFFVISFLIFSCNTYILLLTQGGQILVGMGYALVPIVFYVFYQLIELCSKEFSQRVVIHSIFLGILFAIAVMVDMRLAYILFVLCFIYFFYELLLSFQRVVMLKSVIFLFILPFVITGLLNAFWILPLGIVRQDPFTQLGSAYNSLAAVQYFSFAKFENALSLLHPQWPENIFGKTYFMRPEFLLLPILAFASLLFVKPFDKLREKNRLVLFFALIGLIGIFLAKGANDPFGSLYLWLFGHVPGFMLFRDSTKWYVLIAVGYAVLVPCSLEQMYIWIQTKNKFSIKSKFINLQSLSVLVIVTYLLFLIRPAVLGQLGGTLQAQSVPQEYVTFDNFLSNQNTFSRTLWIPSWERFGSHSSLHPAVGAEDLYHVTSISDVFKHLSEKDAQQILQEDSIKYIILPFDAQGELFLKDRKYDEKLYQTTYQALQKITWLKELPGFGRMHVFEVSQAKDHFWTSNPLTKVSYTKQNLTSYKILLTHAKNGNIIVFSDSYDKNWRLRVGDRKIVSRPFTNNLNSFVLPKSGDYQAHVYYSPQKWVNIGVEISIATIAIIFGYIVVVFGSKKYILLGK